MTAPPEVTTAGRWDLDRALLVADTVLNAVPHPFDRDTRALVLQAMDALGYSAAHMGQALGVAPRVISSTASYLGVTLHRDRAWVDRGAVEFILAGQPMNVTGTTADAAVVALAERGSTCAQVARLTCSSTRGVGERAKRLGVQLQPETSWAWWSTHRNGGGGWRAEPGPGVTNAEKS